MDRSIKIAAVGDISLGDHYFCCGFGVNSAVEKQGSDYIFEHVAAQLSKHDIVFGNLETVLSSFKLRKYKLSSIQMRGNADVVIGLRKAGFSIVSLANNHIMQHGKTAVYETMSMLTQNGIGFCGIKDSHNQYPDSNLITVKGRKICFLGYNNHPQQYFVDAPIYNRFSFQKLVKDIKHSKRKCDLVILSIHWGDEYIEIPSPKQRDIAHQLIESGADVIFGHHPHVIQGIEKYRERYIFYSLGNFVFDMPWYGKTTRTFIISLNCHLSDGKLTYEIIPAKINANYQPTLISRKKAGPFVRYVNRISALIENFDEINVHRHSTFYDARLKKVAESERKLSHKFWFKNILRFNMMILVQYFFEIIYRRIQFINRSHNLT